MMICAVCGEKFDYSGKLLDHYFEHKVDDSHIIVVQGDIETIMMKLATIRKETH